MGSISGFGTAFAAPILALAALTGGVAQSTAATAADNATLDLSVTGLRNNKGHVLVCLTASSKAFPDCTKDSKAHKRTVKANAAGSISFTDLAPGTYAVSLIHDENANGKLDTAMAIPKEGFGFSRNPKITFGPPKFKAASFTLAGSGKQTVKMKYMF